MVIRIDSEQPTSHKTSPRVRSLACDRASLITIGGRSVVSLGRAKFITLGDQAILSTSVQQIRAAALIPETS
jgi:hypothetical protein